MAVLSTTEQIKIQGLPGEGQKMHVLFPIERQSRSSAAQTKPGFYRVDFLLARPNCAKYTSDCISFIKNDIGDSHLKIAKPMEERGPNDIESMVLIGHFGEATIEFRCVVNDAGRIGRVTSEKVWGDDYVHAEFIAYRALMPFLSAWSASLDVPIIVETVQVSDPITHTESLRIERPFREMMPFGGIGPKLSDEFCKFASVYREALNSSSPFYRFLCFYKLVESVYLRQKLHAEEAKSRGLEPKKRPEDVKLSNDAIRGIIGWIYPWEDVTDDFLMRQLLPAEAEGKKFRTIFHGVLEPLRDTIAHTLMKSGEIKAVADRLEDIENVMKWLPLLRLWVRVLLASEFPNEFQIKH
jgi:hypothetical protein